MNKIFDQKQVQSVIEIMISILNLGNIEILENKSISKIEQDIFTKKFGELMGLTFDQV